MTKIIPVLINIRSTYNVGSILRTADGLGIKQIVTIGYTPHLLQKNDPRLPHVINRCQKQISKTALGAEKSINNIHFNDFNAFFKKRDLTLSVFALEQSQESVFLGTTNKEDCYLILGEETKGLQKQILEKADKIVEIPMQGLKNSFNVSVAFAISAYVLSK